MSQIRLLQLEDGTWILQDTVSGEIKAVTSYGSHTVASGQIVIGDQTGAQSGRKEGFYSSEAYLLLNNLYSEDAGRYGGLAVVDDPVSPGYAIEGWGGSTKGFTDASLNIDLGGKDPWAAGDYAMVKGTGLNDGLYEVLSASQDDIVLKCGLTAPRHAFCRTSAHGLGAVGTVYKTRVSALRSAAAGNFEVASGTNSNMSFSAVGGEVGANHLLGGGDHLADTLANLNSKVSDATLIDTTDARLSDDRKALTHDLGGSTHGTTTLSQLNTKIDDATLVDEGDARFTDSRPPNGSASGDLGGSYPSPTVNDGADGSAIHRNVAAELDTVPEKATPVSGDYLIIEDSAAAKIKKKIQIGNLPGVAPTAHDLGGASHNADSLANLNSKISDATLIDTGDSRLSDSRAPSGTAGGDLGGSYPNPTVDDGADGTAFHTDQTGEISGVTEKTNPVSDDFLLIEDSAASFAKKRVKLANMLVSPVGVVTVGATGADYTSIQTAMDAAVAGQTVLVYPGTYAESLDFTAVESSVRVTGTPNGQNVIIAGADTTSSRVILNKTGTLRELTVVGPSSGTNPAIDCSGLPGGNLAVMFNCIVQGGGAGHTGPLVRGAGSGILAAIQGLYHNGGTTSGNFFECTGGVCIGLDWIANVGVCDSFIDVSGGILRLQNLQFQNSALYSCTDAVNVSGGELTAQNITIPHTSSPCTNGLHISGNAVDLDISNASFHGSALDFLVDDALTGSGGHLVMDACAFEKALSKFPSTWNPDLLLVSFIDQGSGGDNPGIKFIGAVDAGTIQFPSSLSVGTGDSSVLGMRAWGYDDSLTQFTEVTAALSSQAGSTATWNKDADDGLYVGFPYKPCMFDTEIVGALDGALDVEVWTGAEWEFIHCMAATSDPGKQFAQKLFERAAGDENLRLNISGDAWANWTANDPPSDGDDLYYIRFRNKGAITTAPTIERIKGGHSYIEEKDSGTNRFGGSERILSIDGIALALATDLSGAAGKNQNIDYGEVINLAVKKNKFENSVTDGFGLKFRIPSATDTSRPLYVRWRWAQVDAGVGDIRFDFRFGRITIGTLLNGGQTEEILSVPAAAVSGTVSSIQETSVELNVSSYLPGDTVIFALRRLGGDGADTFAGSIYIVDLEGDATFYD